MLYRVRGSQLSMPCSVLLAAWWLAGPVLDVARAETPNTRDELRLIESTERDLDPLGLDDDTGAGLEAAARALKAPKAPDPVAQVGDVLAAIDGVFESRHDIQIKLEAGLAFVTHAIEISNRSSHAAEVAYRLRIPQDSALWTFSLCRDGRCREGARNLAKTAANDAAPDAQTAVELPSGEVSIIRVGEGRALSMRARAVHKLPLTLRVTYVTSAEAHGGRVRLSLPARGFDPRVVPADASIMQRGLVDVLPQTAIRVEPSLTIDVVGTLKPRAQATKNVASATCAGAPCSREYRAAAATAISSRDTWLLIDASPSMEGVARSRVPAVLAALLTLMPDDTSVRAFAFAAQAQDLGTFAAIETPLSKLDDAMLAERGAGTRPSTVLTRFHEELARKRPRVIVISDGAIDPDSREQIAFERARRAGAELSLLALSDSPPSARATAAFRASAGVVHVTELADRALSHGELEALSERLAFVLSTPTQGGVRAGESKVIERRSPPRAQGRDGGDWLPRWLARYEETPVLIASTTVPPAAIAAPAYVGTPPASARENTGLPKESVLDMLRTQLVPKARACLRSDRKGRADYAVGLAFRFLIARREVLDASIEGDVAPALRACLLDVLPQLRLPWFTGNLRVRYPIHTEREPEPPVIELEPDAAREVDRVIGKPALRQAP